MGVQHKVPIRVAEDVVAEVWRYDDWSGNVDIRFFKDERKEDPEPLILPGEWLVELGKSKCQWEVANWFTDFIEDFAQVQYIPVKASARLYQVTYRNPQIRTEAVTTEEHTVYLSYPENWDGSMQLEYYERGKKTQTWDISCTWILPIARVAYWEILGKAFISAAEDAQQKSPERESYAWRREA